jgi:uncharacterized protein (TIGR00661 family)
LFDGLLGDPTTMGTIFYSMMGEGRGHATRVRGLVEHLRPRHRLVLFASNDAYALLAPRYHDAADVEVRQIPGLQFRYSNGRMSLPKTLLAGLGFRRRMEAMLDPLVRCLDAERPDLVLTDFEPLLPRAAVRSGLPYLSVDHQHFLLTYDLSSLPLRLRAHARALRPFVRLFHRWQCHTIVSAFFFPPLRPRAAGVTQAGIFLRPEVRSAAPTEGGFVLSYVRKQVAPAVLEALHSCGKEVRVYGLGSRPSEGRLSFHPIDEGRFVDDLANCECLIAGAGNQLLGEALYLGKPVLAIPESRHHEQRINSHFLEQLGGGRAVFVEALEPGDIRQFLRQVDRFRANIQNARSCLDGLPAAAAVIDRYLDPPALRAMPTLPRTWNPERDGHPGRSSSGSAVPGTN